MKIIVPIKQVPETSAVKMDPETGTMIREGLEAIINPLDLYAIEAALALREQCGGSITAMSMGPPKAASALREAIAMGCDDAVLLSHKSFAGSDTWSTSYVLAAAVRKLCRTGILPVQSSGDPLDYEHVERRHGAHLPHGTRQGGEYAVTFRLGDSLPKHVLDAWIQEGQEIAARVVAQNREMIPDEQDRLAELYAQKAEEYLDAGHGACHLRDERVAEVVAEALAHFDGQRYRLLAWSIMPNHVHMVLRPMEGYRLTDILHSLKSYTSKRANDILQRTGKFWEVEYYDHLVRNDQDFGHCIEYAWENPERAGLVGWKWKGRVEGEMLREKTHGQDARGTEEETHGRDARGTLVICGERATDGDTGQVGPEIAAWLDLPVLTYVSRIESLDGNCCRVHRMVETGHEVLETLLPAVLTVVKEIASPRLPTLSGKLRAKATEVPTWTPEDIAADESCLGLAGSPTRVVKIFRPVVARQCRKLTGSDAASIAQSVEDVVEFLSDRELL